MTHRLHHERAADTGWMAHGVCVEHPGLPWTENLAHVPHFLVEAMADLCDRCPVRDECATYAVTMEITAGWWAGISFNGFDATHPPTFGDVLVTRRNAGGADAA